MLNAMLRHSAYALQVRKVLISAAAGHEVEMLHVQLLSVYSQVSAISFSVCVSDAVTSQIPAMQDSGSMRVTGTMYQVIATNICMLSVLVVLVVQR